MRGRANGAAKRFPPGSSQPRTFDGTGDFTVGGGFGTGVAFVARHAGRYRFGFEPLSGVALDVDFSVVVIPPASSREIAFP